MNKSMNLLSGRRCSQQVFNFLFFRSFVSDGFYVVQEAVEENNKKFLAEMHPELEIFSNSKSSLEAPLSRALPIPQELQNRTHSRENSRGMSVDNEPL